jgi:hypothetical protein
MRSLATATIALSLFNRVAFADVAEIGTARCAPTFAVAQDIPEDVSAGWSMAQR